MKKQKILKVQLSVLTTKTKEKIEKEIKKVLETDNTIIASLDIQEHKLPNRKRN